MLDEVTMIKFKVICAERSTTAPKLNEKLIKYFITHQEILKEALGKINKA